MVDLFDQALIHGGQNLVDLMLAALLDLFVVLWNEVCGCVIKRQCIEVVSNPGSVDDILNQVLVVLIDGLQIQVWRPASIDCFAVLVDLDKLEAAGGDGLAVAAAFPNTVVNHKEDSGFDPVVIRVYQYSALLEFAAVSLQHQIRGGMHQGMSGMQ